MNWKYLAQTAVYNGKKDESVNIWERVENVDLEFIGAFLTAHLSLERYVDDYLKLRYETLSWDEARLTFSQKISLIQNEPAIPPYNDIYVRIKDFNSIRNKISHNLNYKLSDKDKSKFKDFYMKLRSDYHDGTSIDLNNDVDLMSFFVAIAKTYFAARIHYYHSKKL
ncbi:hypothetical protein ACT3RR_10075 [Ewingella sp. AOP8-B2-18]